MPSGIVRRRKGKRLAAVTTAAMAFMAIPVYLTDEPAEERVEHLTGVLETMIEEHEEAAEVAMVLLNLVGLSYLVALLFQYRSGSRPPLPLPFCSRRLHLWPWPGLATTVGRSGTQSYASRSNRTSKAREISIMKTAPF